MFGARYCACARHPLNSMLKAGFFYFHPLAVTVFSSKTCGAGPRDAESCACNVGNAFYSYIKDPCLLRISILGTSAKCLDLMQAKGLKPRETHKLDRLHTLLSTGSPLTPTQYDYVYKHVKADVLLGSITGIVTQIRWFDCCLKIINGDFLDFADLIAIRL